MSKGRRRKTGEHYYCMAKKVGYRSRASFKLIQLNQKHDLIRKGNIVVDLGAAPGGWLQVARETVGERGFVFGIDLQPIEKLQENVKTIVADLLQDSTVTAIKTSLPRPADVVLSDASPKISGVWEVDHSRSLELAHAATNIAQQVLAPSGKLLIKVFQGEFIEDFVKEVENRFDFVKVSKPLASRKGSAEVYIIAKRPKVPQTVSISQA